MKLRHVIATAALAIVGAQASAAQLVSNGTFDANLNGWTLGGTTSFASGATGGAALLAGTSDTLSLTLNNLVANTLYHFSFTYESKDSGNAANWNLSGATAQNGAAKSFGAFDFTAQSNTLQISFNGLGSGNKSALIDNVSLSGAVSAVPEPESVAMLVAGLGIVGFMARRRRAS